MRDARSTKDGRPTRGTSRGLVCLGSLVGVVAVLLLAPGAAHACAVCFQAKNDAARVAFILSTAAMTFLPLAVVGFVAWWVRRRFARAELEASPAARLRPPRLS